MMIEFPMLQSVFWNQEKEHKLQSDTGRWKAFKDKGRERTAGQTILRNGSKKMK